MKLLAWAMVLVTTGVAAAQQPAATTQTKTGNAKATQDSVTTAKDRVGASGKDTQSQTKVKAVSAPVTSTAAKTTAPTKEGTQEASSSEVKKTEVKKPVVAATQSAPVPLYQHPTMVTMLQRSNGIRGRVGLRGHRLNPALCQAAQNHAEYMASTGSFSHDTNGGYVYRARRFGFRGNVRENIGWNYANSEQAFAAWQGSGGHYAAIVGPDTTEAGFGFARSANGQTYWVSVYGSATAADIADAKAIFDKDKLAAEAAEAAKLAAEAEDGSKVVPASAETEAKSDKPAASAKPNLGG